MRHPSSNIRYTARNIALTKEPQVYLIIRTGNNCGPCGELVHLNCSVLGLDVLKGAFGFSMASHFHLDLFALISSWMF